jgi:hypothetical protein
MAPCGTDAGCPTDAVADRLVVDVQDKAMCVSWYVLAAVFYMVFWLVHRCQHLGNR